MDINLLQQKFRLLWVRVRISADPPRFRTTLPFVIDIARDGKGEYFDIRVLQEGGVRIETLDVRRDMRHLLLVNRLDGQKFLCGHDERHWFVAAVPGRSASTVQTAMEALKPAAVRQAESLKRLKSKDRFRRKNAAFIRQGEWFFVPAPDLRVREAMIFRNEPISRGAGSKPHMCECIYRMGGETVYVSRQRPNGLTEVEYQRLLESDTAAKNWSWRLMRRNARVFARGRVWHSDHKTIHLNEWHEVFMNNEFQARASRFVAFLD